jgi:hypothetical protein
MTARTLFEELHTRNMRLEPDGPTFRLDAQTEAVTDELSSTLREDKRGFIRLLEQKWEKLEEADRRGLGKSRTGGPATSLCTILPPASYWRT